MRTSLLSLYRRTFFTVNFLRDLPFILKSFTLTRTPVKFCYFVVLFLISGLVDTKKVCVGVWGVG